MKFKGAKILKWNVSLNYNILQYNLEIFIKLLLQNKQKIFQN